MTLDIDDTVDIVHGHQQLSLYNAHHDERCFMPIHVYDTETARPVAILLRPGKTPSGFEACCHVRRLVRRIRKHWPNTRLTICGDGHYGRPEVMTWCEANGVDYIFGLPGNAVLNRLLEESADDVRVRRAETQAPVLRRYAEVRYGAKSWGCERRVSARIEASTMGLAIRCVVINLRTGSAEWLYDTLYCARGQAENLIKRRLGQLASDRTSCRSALANQVHLVLHAAAYWLMLTVRDAIPKAQHLATAEFTTLRLLKIAGRIEESMRRWRLSGEQDRLSNHHNRHAYAGGAAGRFNRAISYGLGACTDERRATEVHVAVHALNRILELGHAISVRPRLLQQSSSA